ncbi:MAG: FGGY-family carbohydrate kinase, partial [Anaerolineae bacterium]|nr:FGGY-family carbohydrate kinase [Anaerolineae bacterium]
MDHLLAYDVGTSGTKAVLVSLDGQIVATAFAPYPLYYPRPGWAEQDPADWWAAAGIAGRQALAQAGAAPGQVVGLAFATQMLNVVALDAHAQPLGRCISWLDSRADDEARRVMRLLGGPTLFAQVVGATLTGKDLLPKYRWLKRHAPDVYRRAATLVDASGYLLYQATGQLVCEWTCASVTGLFNLKTKTWDRALTRFMGLDPARFPSLAPSTAQVGGLTGGAAAYLSLRPGTPVFAGAGDAMAAAVGSGAVGEGEGHLCLGTSGFAGIMTSRRVTGKRGIATVQSADPGKLLMIGETEMAAACLAWAARELYGGAADDASIYAQMDADVAATPPGADGLLFLPWLYGERCPVADEHVRGGFLNLTPHHTRPHLARAVYEGVAFNLAWILDAMRQYYGRRPDPLRVIGGGARSAAWLQILADVTERRLEVVPQPQIAGAVGAAMLAAVGLGRYPSVEAVKAAIPVSGVVAPEPSQRATYAGLSAAFRQVY